MLEDAGLENFPQLWAEAIVSGSLHLDSLYATKLSDSAVNINRSKAEGFRYSQVYKLVCALASSRPPPKPKENSTLFTACCGGLTIL